MSVVASRAYDCTESMKSRSENLLPGGGTGVGEGAVPAEKEVKLEEKSGVN